MNIDKYKLRVAQSKAGIALFLKDEDRWCEANETLKKAYGVQNERKTEARKASDIRTITRV